MRILNLNTDSEIKDIMQDLKVSKEGIEIMLPKAKFYLIRLNRISNISANILKQQLLSLGADLAISRNSLTGKERFTDCLIMATESQLKNLEEKLKLQPFGLDRLADELKDILSNYQKNDFVLPLGKYKLDLSKRTYIMGIVNLTFDSFSGDGLYSKIKNLKIKIQDYALEYVENLIKEGADIIDIGGQSTRPYSKPISIEEELERTIPVIRRLARSIKVPISIDTYRAEVAEQALDNGALIVNDITGLRDPKMLKVIKRYNAAVIIMHMKGMPSTMQINPKYRSLIDEIIEFLDKAIDKALDIGIAPNKIIVDPGIGFGKTFQHNLLIMKALKELKILGKPILIGTSRKSFIGKILKVKPQNRLFGSIASVCLAVINGANIVRVHDVKETKQALRVLDRILKI